MKQSLDGILDEIGRTPLLTHEEELELLEAVQEKGTDCEEMRKLEKANLRFVVSVANQYQKQGLTCFTLSSSKSLWLSLRKRT